MNDTVTIRGNVGGDPVKSMTAGGVPVVHFRVASSTGYWDRRTGSWVEGGTNWYAVSAFRQLADHAKASLRSGDAVIVTGTLKLREWDSNGKRGFSADLDAEAIGHDLRWGTSAFVRAPRPAQAPPAQPPAGEQAGVTSVDPGADPGAAPTLSDEDTWNVAGLEPTGAADEADADQEDSYASA